MVGLMLDLFKNPSTLPKAQQGDLVILKAFIEAVKTCHLPESTKQDCIKILETMCWIKMNPTQLREFIDHKENYLPQLPTHDQANGVVRDHLGTSLHFNSYQWCPLIHLSSDPNSLGSEKLKKLVHNQPTYALFDNTLYFVNSDARVSTCLVNLDNITTLKTLFPKHKDVLENGSKKHSELIKDFGGHTVQTPGERAVHDLLEIVFTFEKTFQHLEAKKDTLGLLSFIAKCHYDKDRGCLEARVEKAMLFAGKIASSDSYYLELGDLLHICQLIHFLDLDNDIYNFVMAKEFFAPFHGQLVFYEGEKQPLTQALIFTAMEDLLSYEQPSQQELTEEIAFKTTDFQAWQAKWYAEAQKNQSKTFQRLIKEAEVVVGRLGMLQYWFKKQDNADELSQWLRSCKFLADYEIHRCRTKQELRGTETEYVVRLMPLQHDVLTGKISTSIAKVKSEVTQTQDTPKKDVVTKKIVNDFYEELISCIRGGDSVKLLDLISQASPEVFNQALLIKNRNNDTPLSWVAQYQNSAVFQVLIDKASPEVINKALLIKNKNNHTPLSYAAQYQNSNAFQALIDKASTEAINKALLIQNYYSDYSNTPLSFAARYQNSNAFQALIAKASPEAINQALLIKNNYDNHTPLSLAIKYQSSDACQALIDKASTEVINQALLIKDSNNCTLLSLAAEYNRSALQALIAKASTETINKALLIKDSDNDTLLSLVEYNSNALQALIAK